MLCRDPCPPRAAPAAWARLRPRALPLPVRPGPARPRVCSCSRGGRLSLRGAEAAGSPALGGFAPFHVEVFPFRPQEAALRALHSFARRRCFIPACQPPSQGPQETRSQGPFARSLCVLGGKALSARPWAGGQDSPWHRRLRSSAGRASRVTRPVWGPRAAGHAAALGTEA